MAAALDRTHPAPAPSSQPAPIPSGSPSHPAHPTTGARHVAPARTANGIASSPSAAASDDAMAALLALYDDMPAGDSEPPLPPHLASLLAEAERATAAYDTLTAAERARPASAVASASSATPARPTTPHTVGARHAAPAARPFNAAGSAPAAPTPHGGGATSAPAAPFAPGPAGSIPDLAARLRDALARSVRHDPDLDDLDADDSPADDLAADDADPDADQRPHDFGGRAALREQAWTLHCQGMRAPTIARELDVPERTIRRWLAATQDEVAAEHPTHRAEQLLHAVESLRELLAATWAAYHDERDLDSHLANTALAEADDLYALRGEPNTTDAVERAMRRRSAGPRYLTLALAIQKETNRLLGLHRPPAPLTPAAPTSQLREISAISATSATSANPPLPLRPGSAPSPGRAVGTPTAQVAPNDIPAIPAIPATSNATGRVSSTPASPPDAQHSQPPRPPRAPTAHSAPALTRRARARLRLVPPVSSHPGSPTTPLTPTTSSSWALLALTSPSRSPSCRAEGGGV